MTLAEQFTALDNLLYSTRQYWQCTAFDYDELPWSSLSAPLEQLSDSDVAELDSDQDALYAFFSSHIEGVEQLSYLSTLSVAQVARTDYPFWISNGIKGRKFEQ